MQLVFDDEQEELRRSVRRLLEQKAPLAATRELMGADPGYDREVWKALGEQMGVLGLAIPEEYGGSGSGLVETVIIAEEMGRLLVPSPFLGSSVLGAALVVESGDVEACAELLASVADGSRTIAGAVCEADGVWRPEADEVATTATSVDGAWTLNGTKAFVLDGHDADAIVVLARDEQGLGLFVVDGDAHGVQRVLEPGLDQTRRLASITLEDAPARRLHTTAPVAQVVDRVRDRAGIALAAEQVGAARAALDMAVDYSKTREQFGRPIGTFQALKHKASEVFMRVEAARGAMLYSAWAVDADADDVPVAAAIAQATSAEAFSLAAGENIQIHGGIGFTWEHDAHLYFKRSAFDRSFLGDPTHHRARLADQIEL